MAVEGVEDIGDVLELSSALLEVHCRVFGLGDLRTLVLQYCPGNGRRDVQGSLWLNSSHSCRCWLGMSSSPPVPTAVQCLGCNCTQNILLPIIRKYFVTHYKDPQANCHTLFFLAFPFLPQILITHVRIFCKLGPAIEIK